MDYYLGEILLLPFGYAPAYTADCAGQVLQISQNAALYSLLGITYGGDGVNNFKLPNLGGAEPLLGMRYCIVTQGLYPPRP
ncbi:phage tail protein [Bacteroides sp.]|uniref:phage tail protein n=1 Tax=Bacteroides sp. TaxID=29523 RepID=UPI00345CCE31